MSENELVRELEEDIRREHWHKLWRGFGSAMVGLSLLVILTTIGVVAWQHHTQEARIARTSQFLKGIERYRLEDYQGALAVFSSFADSGADDMTVLAKFWIGEVMLKMKQPERAQAAYAEVAGKTNTDPVWRDLASLLSIHVQHESSLPQKVKETPPQPGSPFYFTADEQSAVAGLSSDEHDKAVTQLNDLHNDPLAPASLRDRAGELLAALGPATPQKPGARENAAPPGE